MANAATPDLSGRVAAVVTASDGVADGTREDRSGDALAERLRGAGVDDVHRTVVPDEVDDIRTAIRTAVDGGSRVVVVTGGTGLGPRDVTPEAVADVTTRTIPGFGEVMRATGRVSTPLADLSRSVAATFDQALVLAVPGSPSGAVESLDAVLGLVPHVLDLLAGDTAHDTATTRETHPAVDAGAHDHAAHDHGSPDRANPPHGEPGHTHDASCDLAHGDGEQPPAGTLMAVFASPLSALLLAWGRELGYETVLVDPRVDDGAADHGGMQVVATTAGADADTDIVVTDHHRDELVDLIDAALDTDARFIGLMGSARVEPPHVAPLRERGRDDEQIDRVVRPIGIDIGSKTPAEIAVSTLADLVARRRGVTIG